MSNIQTPFTFPIFSKIIEEDTFNLISKDVFDYIDSNPQEFKTVWNCPTKSTIESPPETSFKSQILEKELLKNITEYHNTWEFPPCTLSIQNLWVNISPQESYQETHNHQSYYNKCLYSGVLYIDSEKDSGDLYLDNPIKSYLQGMLPSSNIKIKHHIPPQPGLFVIFPSWLEHGVLQNKNPKDRISVSWNIVATPPNL